MEKLEDWALEGGMIVKEIGFRSFDESIDFIGKVGEIAKDKNHNPMIMVNQGLVRLMLTTKNIKGVSEKDFEIAEEVDNLLKENTDVS
jgi:4a-hydroxytetrahydrobiopterin dehydratase